MAERRKQVIQPFQPGEYPSKLFGIKERADNLLRLGVFQSHMDFHEFKAPEGLEKDHHFWNVALERYVQTAKLVRRRLRKELPDTEDTTRRDMARKIALESALDQAEAMTALDKLRLTDGLTGAWSRVALDAYLSHLIKKDNGNNPPSADPRYTALLFLDLDHFKEQNDKYGHDHGDNLLIETVKAIKEETREEFDLVGRYGGEEFAVILPNMPSIERLIKKAEEINKAIKSKVGITASIGVSVITSNDDEPKTVYKRADRAVYIAKRAGRNRVVMQIAEENGSAAFVDFSEPGSNPIVEIIGRIDKHIGEQPDGEPPVITKLAPGVPAQPTKKE